MGKCSESLYKASVAPLPVACRPFNKDRWFEVANRKPSQENPKRPDFQVQLPDLTSDLGSEVLTSFWLIGHDISRVPRDVWTTHRDLSILDALLHGNNHFSAAPATASTISDLEGQVGGM